MKKKRNKKYNPVSRAINFAKKYTQEFAMVWAGTIEPRIVKIKDNSFAVLTEAKLNALTKVPHRWQVHLCCMLRDHTGRDYLQSQELRFYQEYYSEDISDLVNDHMKKFIKTCNANHVVNVGWVATTRLSDLTDNDLTKMMDKIGAWEFLAKHEVREGAETLSLGDNNESV